MKVFFTSGNRGQKNEGSILPTVLGVFFIFSLSLTVSLRIYRRELFLQQQIKEFYQRKTLWQLTYRELAPLLVELSSEEDYQGASHFNWGSVFYEVAEGEISYRIQLENRPMTEEVRLPLKK